MKIRKENIKFWKDEFVRIFKILFFISPLFLIAWAVIMGLAPIFGGLKSINMTSEECLHDLKVSFPFLIIYAIVWWKLISKMMEKDAKKEAQEKEERLLRFEVQYANYADLVYEVAKEHFKAFLDMAESKEYLLRFGDNLNKLPRYRNIEKPDSFIVATLLMYSLIDQGTVDNLENVEFAMKCAWKVISEPVTYSYKDGDWIEEKHPKTDIVLAEELMSSIKKTIVQDYKEKKTSFMQMANLLHLIYLNSSNK